ncbi:hypothetical protein OF83DRAFT_44482 [Amylostereum chailletii]|nr:hypothetical protein OF83DRAFT_44482 [Amylostereum chailletii]
MLLSLRSGIHSEIAWAFDRLCRLCNNEQFFFRSIPGLTDALFEWPEWFAAQSKNKNPKVSGLFALSAEEERKRRHGLEALFVMRNAAVNEPNAEGLAAHKKTKPLILSALHNIQPDSDVNTEFLLHTVELLQFIAPTWTLPAPFSPPESLPLQPLLRLAGHSSNRSLIIASLTSLTLLFSIPANQAHLTADSPALTASIRYLPLFADKPLIDACLNYLYTHLSSPPMAKAFLLHDDMPSTLKVLVAKIVSEQLLENVTIDVGPPVATAPVAAVWKKPHSITPEELSLLLVQPEPQRCFEWMKIMFVAQADGELTQVDFWTFYKDLFAPYGEQYGGLLVASDVIKNVNLVFPQAQAMVLPGPPQKFIVRGVARRMDETTPDRFKCQWNSGGCVATPFASSGDLYDHVLEHINNSETDQNSCLWHTCSQKSLHKERLRVHVLTHLPSQPVTPHPDQGDTVTLPTATSPYPDAHPTQRPPPPPRSTKLAITKPLIEPSSSALTALLSVRVLFRTAFATVEAAPRVDADHFGFPGIVEDDSQEGLEELISEDSDERGARRGRKAFVGVKRQLEGVQMKEETLMSWVTEMAQAVS